MTRRFSVQPFFGGSQSAQCQLPKSTINAHPTDLPKTLNTEGVDFLIVNLLVASYHRPNNCSSTHLLCHIHTYLDAHLYVLAIIFSMAHKDIHKL